MIHKSALTTIAIATIALASACQNDSAPVSPDVEPLFASATAGTEVNERTPFNTIVFIPCANGGAGEFVEMNGTLHTLINIRSDNNGGFGLKIHSQPQGLTGIGSISGVKYQGTGVSQSNQNVKAGETYTTINNFRMLGQGKGNNLTVHDNAHYTIHANGTMTAVHDNPSVDCK